jgi:HEAT repeat protein
VRLAADADSEVRKSAVDALGWIPGHAATLLAALADPDPDVVVTTLEALARAGTGTVEALSPLRAHADAEIRLRAAEALARLSPSPALEEALADPDERVRAAAIAVHPDRLSATEPSVLVRRAGRPAPDDPDALVRATGGDGALAAGALGVLAREDDLVHVSFSWNDQRDRPTVYRTLRPPVLGPYGHPHRG